MHEPHPVWKSSLSPPPVPSPQSFMWYGSNRGDMEQLRCQTGYVFLDDPKSAGSRYDVNVVALKRIETESEGDRNEEISHW